MPTWDEIKELFDNCTYTETTQDGVNGYEMKSKKNGNSIFLPAAGRRIDSELYDAGSQGFYWSSSLRTSYANYTARFFYIVMSGSIMYVPERCTGFSVRPVRP